MPPRNPQYRSPYDPSQPAVHTAVMQKRRHKRLRFFGLFTIVLIGAVVALHIFVLPHKIAAISTSLKADVTTPVATTPTISAPTTASTADLQTMTTTINQLLAANSTVDTTVSLIDLNNNKSYNFGPAVPYVAASVAKLITAGAYLHDTEIGTQSLSTVLETGNTAAVDLQQMIVNSDNTSWQSINDQLTPTGLGDYANSIGITDYDLDTNTLTTTDIAGLLQKLYGGTLLNKSDTSLLLGYMKIANEANYITPVIPKDVTVYHKAGLLDDRVHDAAIIDNSKTPLVLVIFTNGHGTYDFPARTILIQSITKAVLTAYNIT